MKKILRAFLAMFILLAVSACEQPAEDQQAVQAPTEQAPVEQTQSLVVQHQAAAPSSEDADQAKNYDAVNQLVFYVLLGSQAPAETEQ